MAAGGQQVIQINQLTQAMSNLAPILESQASLQNRLASDYGLVEQASMKLGMAYRSSPIVQFKNRVVSLGKAIQKVMKLTMEWTHMSDEEQDTRKKNMSILQKLMVVMLAHGKLSEWGNKLAKDKNNLWAMMAIKMLAVFGIILIFVIGLAMLAIALNGAESDLLDFHTPIIDIHGAIEGLVLIITGEGEGGFVGALNVLSASLIVATAAMLAFGLPFAIIIGTIMLTVGAFRLVEKATGSSAAATGVALGVVIVGFGAFLAALGVIAWSTVLIIFLPIGVIVAGLVALWAAFTGRAPVWVGVVAAVAIGLALAFLFPLIALPIAIVAVIAIIVLLAVRWKTGGYDFVMKVIAWMKGLSIKGVIAVTLAVAFFVSLPVAIVVLLLIVLVKNWSRIMAWGAGVKANVFAAFRGVGMAFTALVIQATAYFVTTRAVWAARLTKVITDIQAGPGKLKDKLMAGLGQLGLAMVKFYNKHVAGWFSFDIPKFLGGGHVEFPPIIPLPSYMAEGGIVTGPTLAMIGEAGPEAVIPLDKGYGIGQTININIDVSGMTDRSDKRAFAREISDILAEEMRRSGGNTVRGRF
jgi:hypothetical protein